MMPPFLKSGDMVQIVSPASAIHPSYVEGAKRTLSEWNLKVLEGKYARSAYGRFAGTKEERIFDLQQALDDPEVKAIFMSRGGYGLVQIIDKINFEQFKKSPKWLIGFSDISILHAAVNRMGIASIHGIMAKHLAELPRTSDAVFHLREILFGRLPVYQLPFHPLNRQGKITAKLLGGNLSVLMGLRGTSFDLPFEDAVLFVEDTGEKPYQVDRMIQNLRIGGIFEKISGLIVGQFTDYESDPLMMQTIEEMFAEAVKNYSYPVCFNFPAGHIDYNLPLLLGENITLEVSAENVLVDFNRQ
ncbi:MAG TPA: LD-carboxypeptidase [Paludibacteraceae bacterium]|jgi:muramoyltetrapeptide carboxypeptidase|nr:LD-carboxypeptidase [Paludibacteraceae bacterium]OPZ02132.1 MAG: putative murein peptide carboxypeptidase [Bacteroidetes bacterium ADurb.BinA395]MBP8967421.1 LD-carboxypeptidase [Paludibacteraceae bacterium]HOF98525.1 LD-carboxypeptidase [Paludibacteraceae bacterium]HOJ67137.1 LD-carboxypeptidase [Paludibacteraceae bacterium]